MRDDMDDAEEAFLQSITEFIRAKAR